MRLCARARRPVASDAAGHRAMVCKLRIRAPMTVEAEAVEPRLNSCFQVRAMTAMTWDARVEACLIDVVVVAQDAVDAGVLVVREVERQRGRAIEHRLAESRAYPDWRESGNGHGGSHDRTYDPS